MDIPRYQTMIISNPEDYINTALAQSPMHQHLEIVALSPCKINRENGEVLSYLMVLKLQRQD